MIGRRTFIGRGLAIAVLGAARGDAMMLEQPMYGLIGKIVAAAGRRDALLGILLEGTAAMPGCLSYVVARDAADENAIWVTEVWESEASHRGSLELPAVQDAIRRGRPMIAGFESVAVTAPLGGVGLPLA